MTAFSPSCASHTAAIPLCIGSDSNVRIDPLEELRELEGIARRQSGQRGVLSDRRPATPSDASAAHRLFGLDGVAAGRSRSTSTIARLPVSLPSTSRAALIAGCAADVVVTV